MKKKVILEVHGAVGDFGRELGLPVLDLLPAFLGEDGPALWVHPTNQHPNERAHALAGEALQRFLEAPQYPIAQPSLRDSEAPE